MINFRKKGIFPFCPYSHYNSFCVMRSFKKLSQLVCVWGENFSGSEAEKQNFAIIINNNESKSLYQLTI